MSGDHPSEQQIAAAAAAGGWQFGEPPSVPICQGFQMGSSSCPPVESFQSSLWDPSFSVKPAVLPPRLDMGWNSPDPAAAAARLGVFSGGMLPPSLSNFAVDSSFIERAARFSNFSGGGSLGAVPPNHPFGPSGASEVQIQSSEGMRDASVSMDHESRSESPMKNHHREDVVSGEASPGGFANVSGDSSSKGLSAKKRKKNNQEMELDPSCPQFSAESPMENAEAKQKVGNSSSTQANGKSTGKNAKGSSEPPKEDYIHVRARRGQATNSHSLAERVRRERISERMKYLQDLVPGCSKVTGKAVMLDEIINYVQSLQRQVEFLSMKLATVNPSVEFNIEGLLSKDLSLQQLLQSRGGPSTMGFSQELLHPQLLPSQQCLVETGIPGIVNQSDALRRAINAQFSTVNGFKEPPPQIMNQWDAEINNVMQMSYGANPPPNTQESNVKPHDSYQM